MKKTPTAPPLFMDDPNWADFIPDLASSSVRCRCVAHEDCSPLDADAAAAHLAPGGTLGAFPNYEMRPGQLDMARAVTRAYNSRSHLMIEAGTGVGKSLAYIIPSILWSWTNDTPVVISTATRNLQSQLISSDIPRAAHILGEDAARLRTTVLKGRSNYLCLRALADYMQGGYYSLTAPEQHAFAAFIDWLHETEDGDLDACGQEELRKRLTSAGEDCLGRICPWAGKCFVAKAHARALRAHLVIVNHALVLSDAANPGADLLPPAGRIVFDEAHDLDDIATDFFSYEFSPRSLGQLLGKLSRTGRGRRAGSVHRRGFVGQLERQLRQGRLGESSVAEELRFACTQAITQSAHVRAAADDVFGVLKGLFAPHPHESIIRYRVLSAGMGEEEKHRQFARNGIFADYDPILWDESLLTSATDAFEEAMARLQSTLAHMADTLEHAQGADELPLFGDLTTQARTLAAHFTQYVLETKFILGGMDDSRVFWAERLADGEKKEGADGTGERLRLVAAPLSIADEMKKAFFDVKDSVILCSATLRTGDKFDYMARKLGVADYPQTRVKALVAASPFDYFRQACVCAVDFLPDPAAQSRAYIEAFVPFLRDLFARTRGRALVLFTAYDMMRTVAQRLRPELEEAGCTLLVQGEGLSREAMTRALKNAAREARACVLFGAKSFWEGVDVPGEALSCVVLARLPFPQVGEPIVEARSEKITASGGSAFRDYMLPEALIAFRQGFGRLVRTKSDRGLVVIADSRIASKNYGAVFRRALPASVHIASSAEDVFSQAKSFMPGA